MLKHIQSKQEWSEKSFSAKGFTLIELLVVIVILGVLAAVVVFSVRGVTNDSEENACLQEKRTLETAVEAYYAKEGSFPNSNGNLLSAGLIRDATTTNYSVGSNGTVNPVSGSNC